MSVVLVEAPAKEPVLLEDAKSMLRIDADITTHDTLIKLFIQAAREQAEHELGRALITQTLKAQVRLILNPPPALPYQYQSLPGILYLQPGQTPIADIPLPRVGSDTIRLADIVSAKLIALDGTETELDSSDWSLYTRPLTPRIRLKNPNQIFDAEVTYKAGFGDAPEKVPAAIRRWILFQVNTMFENREQFVVGQTVTPLPNEFVNGQLDPYRIPVPV